MDCIEKANISIYQTNEKITEKKNNFNNMKTEKICERAIMCKTDARVHTNTLAQSLTLHDQAHT